MLLIGTVDREILEQQTDFHKQLEHPSVPVDLTSENQDTPLKISQQPPKLFIRPAPIRFVGTTPLAQMHILFSTIKLQQAFVTANGRLKGVISRKQLKECIDKLDHKLTLLKD
jgi:hypothetical protein